MVVRLHHGEVSVSGKTKLFDIPLHFRFVLCFPVALVNKGYFGSSGIQPVPTGNLKPQPFIRIIIKPE